MIVVKDLDTLNKLSIKQIGNIAYLEDETQIYRYTEDNEWVLLDEKQAQGTGLTLYQLNKMIIPQMPSLTKEEIEKKKELINNFNDGKYYLLFNKATGYFTFFSIDNTSSTKFSNEVIECLKSIGEIKCGDYDEKNNVIEFWVCDPTGAAEPYYLIDWTGGTIHCSI